MQRTKQLNFKQEHREGLIEALYLKQEDYFFYDTLPHWNKYSISLLTYNSIPFVLIDPGTTYFHTIQTYIVILRDRPYCNLLVDVQDTHKDLERYIETLHTAIRNYTHYVQRVSTIWNAIETIHE